MAQTNNISQEQFEKFRSHYEYAIHRLRAAIELLSQRSGAPRDANGKVQRHLIPESITLDREEVRTLIVLLEDFEDRWSSLCAPKRLLSEGHKQAMQEGRKQARLDNAKRQEGWESTVRGSSSKTFRTP